MKKSFSIFILSILTSIMYGQVSYYSVEPSRQKTFQVEFDINFVYEGVVILEDNSRYWATITMVNTCKGDGTKIWGGVPQLHTVILKAKWNGVNHIDIDPIPISFDKIKEIIIKQ